MTEKETIFSSSVKYGGIFNFQDFYKFCYDWLNEDFELTLLEKKYVERIEGDAKKINVEWEGVKYVTDYFKFQVKVEFEIIGLKKVEVERDGVKEQTNKGNVKVKVKGVLQRDYKGKFESTGFQKFMRAVYEKWIIASRVEEYEDNLAGKCDEFLSQVKAYLDLEGKK